MAGLLKLARALELARKRGVIDSIPVLADNCRDMVIATMDGALWQRLVVERG